MGLLSSSPCGVLPGERVAERLSADKCQILCHIYVIIRAIRKAGPTTIDARFGDAAKAARLSKVQKASGSSGLVTEYRRSMQARTVQPP
jgi:hypothetical protein